MCSSDLTEGEGIVRTEHEKILVLGSDCCAASEILEEGLAELRSVSQSHDGQAIRNILKQLVPEYAPESN